MDDVIDRLNAAIEGSRELDWYVAGCPYWDDCHDGIKRPNYNNPAYTTSLDAALTLIPEGCGWHILYDDPEEEPGSYTAYVSRNDYGRSGYKTAALALCGEALRARMRS